MFQKTVIIVGVGALVCGLTVVSASAKHRHHIRHHVMAAKAEPMKTMPGNNPFTIAPHSETNRAGHPVPVAMAGNNPMVIVKPK
jgi:hypothetical protein